MNTTCKFKCDSITYSTSGATVILTPVTNGSPENDSYFKYTPYGKFEMGLLSVATAATFIPGEQYYINITPAN